MERPELQAVLWLQPALSASPNALTGNNTFYLCTGQSKVRENCFLEPDWPPLPHLNGWSVLVARHFLVLEREHSTEFHVVSCGPQDISSRKQNDGGPWTHWRAHCLSRNVSQQVLEPLQGALLVMSGNSRQSQDSLGFPGTPWYVLLW